MNTYAFLRDAHTYYLFQSSNILKFHGKVAIENYLLIHNCFKKNQLPQTINSWFVLSSDTNTPNKRWFSGCLKLLSRRNKFHEKNFVNVSAIFPWNYLQNLYKNKLFHQLTKNGLKKVLLATFLFRKYTW